jgi:hypothetical protein
MCLTIWGTPALASAEPTKPPICRIQGAVATCPAPWVDWVSLELVELRSARDSCAVREGLCQARQTPPAPPPLRVHPLVWVGLGLVVGAGVGVLVTR